jgi:hypothetical protein
MKEKEKRKKLGPWKDKEREIGWKQERVRSKLVARQPGTVHIVR